MQKAFFGLAPTLQTPKRSQANRGSLVVRAGPYDEELIQTAVSSPALQLIEVTSRLRADACDTSASATYPSRVQLQKGWRPRNKISDRSRLVTLTSRATLAAQWHPLSLSGIHSILTPWGWQHSSMECRA